nr:retrovirus-related Pol polyprotein from transposon TNT 1-94 [Tanacetum cinerariifolium]
MKERSIFRIQMKPYAVFNQYKVVKTLFEAIQARFGGNNATKKTQKTLLNKMYENFNAPSTESFDSIFNRLQKIVSQLAILGLLHEDLEKIHEGDLEEMDLKWQLALLSMRGRRECISPRNQESRPKNQDSSRKTVNVEDTSSKAMVAIDEAGFDWGYMADDEAPTNMALMAFSDSDISDSDEDEYEVMVLKSNNAQHKPEQANQPRKVSQNPKNNNTNWNEMRTQNLGVGNFTPTTVLTKSGIVPISTARQSSSRAATPVSAARLINTAAPKALVNDAKPRQNALQKAHINAVKFSACSVWRPKIKVQDHVSKNSGSYICKRFDYVNPEGRLKEHDGGMLHLGKELKVVILLAKAQSELMYDKKNSVLCTDTECFILSPNFKLADESHVLLKVPRKNNMYSFDMKNIVRQKDLTCLLAKATTDESMLWVDERRNRTLIKAERTISHALSFMRPFGCHVTILNTLDQLRKFDGKSDEGIFVSYSTISKAFRVYNTGTRKVEENLHITFLENKPMITGGGPEWLFDIDAISDLMNYAQVPAGTNSNDFADSSLFDSSSQDSYSHNKDKHGPSQESECDNQERPNAESSTKNVNTAGPSINTANANDNTGSLNINTISPLVNTATHTYADYPSDPLMSDLEDIIIFDDAYDDRDEGA